MNALATIASYAALPVAGMIAAVAVGAARTPSPTWRSAILHFGAGVIFSVTSVEMLPRVMAEHRPLEVCLGFALGVILMLGIRQVTRDLEQGATRKSNWATLPLPLLIGIAVDAIIDGMLLGIGVLNGSKAGMLLMLALTIEGITLGLTVAAAIPHVSSKSLLMRIGSALALCFFVGAIGSGLLFSSIINHYMAVVLPFGIAALLFLVTEELLVDAHEATETPMLTTTFFAGFLSFLLLGMLL